MAEGQGSAPRYITVKAHQRSAPKPRTPPALSRKPVEAKPAPTPGPTKGQPSQGLRTQVRNPLAFRPDQALKTLGTPVKPDTSEQRRVALAGLVAKARKAAPPTRVGDYTSNLDMAAAQLEQASPRYAKTLAIADKSRLGSMGIEQKEGVYYKTWKRKFLPDAKYPVDPNTGKALAPKQAIKIASAHPQLMATGPDAAIKVGSANIIKFLNRPVSAVAGGAQAAITHQNIGKAVGGGLSGKDHVFFSDVLKSAGVKNKWITGIGGFIGDVVLDPTTYLTLGTGVAAKQAAKTAASEAERVYAKALASGMSKDGAQTVSKRAAKQALEQAQQDYKGVKVGLKAGVPLTRKRGQVSGVVRAPVAVNRKLTDVSQTIRTSQPAQRVSKAFLPNARLPGETAAQRDVRRQAVMGYAHGTVTAERAIGRKAKALEAETKRMAQQGNMPHHEAQRALLDLIEREGIDTSHPLAKAIQEYQQKGFQAEKVRGLRQDELTLTPSTKGYVPHVLKDVAEPPTGLKGLGAKMLPPKGRSKVPVPKQREIRKSLEELRTEGRSDLFSEKVAPVFVSRERQREHDIRLSDMWQKVASTGEKIRPGMTLHHLQPGQLVYRVTPRGLEPISRSTARGSTVPDLDKTKRIMDAIGSGKSKDHYVILHQDVVSKVQQDIAPIAGHNSFYDYIQGQLKKGFTIPHIGYHVRNALGDTFNAWLGDAHMADFKDATSLVHSRRLRRKAEEFNFAPEVHPKMDTKIKAGKHEFTHGQLLDIMENHGVVGQGFVGGELHELVQGEGRFARASQAREDVPRAAVFLAALREGKTITEAAAWSKRHQIDYTDLTHFERTVMRRAFPFYTFWARNAKNQAIKVVTRPGKYSNFGSVLNEAAKSSGYDDYDTYLKSLSKYQQNGLPIPFKFGGKVYGLQVQPPATDLNHMTLDPREQAQLIANRLTFYKTIGEVLFNYSLFFRKPIQPENKPRVAAPDLVGQLPGPVKHLLGVSKIKDPNDPKKMVWGWYANTDYVIRSLPFGNFVIGAGLGQTTGSRGNTGWQSVMGEAGLKVTPVEKKALSAIRGQIHDLESARGAMRQQGLEQTPKYLALTQQWRQAKLAERAQLQKQQTGKTTTGSWWAPGKTTTAPTPAAAGGGWWK